MDSPEGMEFIQRNSLLDFGFLTVVCPALQAGSKLRADGVKRSIDACGQSVHSGSCAEGDQGNNQCIFDQVLTVLAAYQPLKLNIQLEKVLIHLSILHALDLDFPSSQE